MKSGRHNLGMNPHGLTIAARVANDGSLMMEVLGKDERAIALSPHQVELLREVLAP